MKVIVIASQKGGVGKTTTATAVANVLTIKGYKTLLIDADKQGNSTDTYTAEFEGVTTLYDVLLDDDHVALEDAIQHTEAGDIVAADPLLNKGDAILTNDPEGEFRLLNAIEQLEGYDYVIIDTAPSADYILRNCLICATHVVVPATADRYGYQGLAQLLSFVSSMKKRKNPNLKIAGILLTKYSARTNLAKGVKNALEEIASENDTILFDTAIRESTKTKEAQTMRKTLFKYAPSSTTAEDYITFTNELIKVIGD